MMIVTKSTRMPSPRERMDRYLDALKGNFDPHDHAARTARGLRLMERFQWRNRDVSTPNDRMRRRGRQG